MRNFDRSIRENALVLVAVIASIITPIATTDDIDRGRDGDSPLALARQLVAPAALDTGGRVHRPLYQTFFRLIYRNSFHLKSMQNLRTTCSGERMLTCYAEVGANGSNITTSATLTRSTSWTRS